MKNLFLSLILILILTATLPAQSTAFDPDKYHGTMSELYLNRQPSAKSEAMGRGLVANTENDFGSYYNPALTSLGTGITVNTSFSSPYYLAGKSKFNYFGASYSNKKLGGFAFSRYFWTFGEDIPVYNEQGVQISTGDVNYSLYTLNYSREIIKDLSAGLNIAMVQMHFPPEGSGASASTGTAYTLDLGVLKKFEIISASNKNLNHSVNIGSSIYNLTSTKISVADDAQKEALPVLFRIGTSYNLKLKGSGIIPNSNILELLTHIEYQNVLNSDYDKMFKIGQEVTVAEIISLRCGYFSQKLDNFGYPSANADKQSQFTYGAGVKIPLGLIFKSKTPISLTVDYVNLEQPTFLAYDYKWENFSTVSVNLKFAPF